METDPYSFWFCTGIILIAISILSRLRVIPAFMDVALLMLGTFCIGVWSISVDPFLHGWDERFHALVAQNMLENPFRPTLFKENIISRANYSEWWTAHIWMHKGPLFSWQMGLCIWLLGKSVLTMRLASVFMVMLIVYSGYRSARIFFPKIAFTVGLILSLQPFLYLFASGRIGMDHNDLAFTAYIGASFWAWCEYLNSGRQKWVIWIAVATACAILTKWFAGSLIYCMWGLYILLFEIRSVKQWRALVISVAVCALITGSWFTYCYLNFRDVLVKEWELNGSSHLFKLLDGHVSEWYFHFKTWFEHLLPIVFFFIAGIFFTFKSKDVFFKRIALVTVIALVLCMTVFSIAKTRMPGYTMILIVPATLIASCGLNGLLTRSHKKWFLRTGILVIALASVFYLKLRFSHFRPKGAYRVYQIALNNFYSDLGNKLPQNSVIFNTPQMEFVDVMFYSDRVAYEKIPTPEDIEEMESKGYEPVIILDSTFTHEEYEAQEYLSKYKVYQWPY